MDDPELGPELEQVVTDLLARGVFASRDEVLRMGVKLIVERETRLAELDAAGTAGIADTDARRTIDADELFDELIAQRSTAAHRAAIHAKIEQGIAEADAGKLIPVEDVIAEFRQRYRPAKAG